MLLHSLEAPSRCQARIVSEVELDMVVECGTLHNQWVTEVALQCFICQILLTTAEGKKILIANDGCHDLGWLDD